MWCIVGYVTSRKCSSSDGKKSSRNMITFLNWLNIHNENCVFCWLNGYVLIFFSGNGAANFTISPIWERILIFYQFSIFQCFFFSSFSTSIQNSSFIRALQLQNDSLHGTSEPSLGYKKRHLKQKKSENQTEKLYWYMF